MQRVRAFVCCLAVLFLSCGIAFASELAEVTGYVSDPTGARILHCRVQVTNVETNVSYFGETNDVGLYRIPALPVGNYRVIVQKTGFKTVVKQDIELHVQDVLALNFQMEIGAAEESISVKGGTPLIDTESASVSTVIDRNFAENLPMNGRSFNTLLQLTPGVVIAPTGSFSPGQFSINGQRTNSNYFTIDGVSANFGGGAQINLGQSGTGSTQGFNIFGGTSGLVSVDAMQEFRVQTSTFAPEYGRTPGGQVAITTRSGTNELHGTTFDYLRNDAFDANDWFANRLPGGPHAALRQNDFGGVFSGALIQKRTFFFLSYEGLVLRLPKTNTITVPSTALRSSGTTAINAVLSAYPLPNGPLFTPNTAEFSGTYSDSGSTHSGSARIDHTLSKDVYLFGRYNYSPSESKTRGADLATVTSNDNTVHTLTIGSTAQISNNKIDTTRVNYSVQATSGESRIDGFAGGTSLDASLVIPSPFSANNSLATFILPGLSGTLMVGNTYNNRESQIGVANDFAWTKASHELKFGVDWRDLRLSVGGRAAGFSYASSSGPGPILTGTFPFVIAVHVAQTDMRYRSVSLYAQDAWRVLRSLTLTYGLRWEINPAPSSLNDTVLLTFQNIDNPSQLTPAPAGTPLWSTTYGNVAPRFGLAYKIAGRDDLVVRGGWGIFYDLGEGRSASAAASFPNFVTKVNLSQPFPLQNAASLVPLQASGPPYSSLILFAPNLKLPYSQEWDVAFESGLGKNQTITATYDGQIGQRLLFQEDTFGVSPLVQSLFVTRNGAESSYNALQIQFKRSLSHRFQALASYTWSHSIDDVSDDVTFGIPAGKLPLSSNRGASDFDVRHNFTGALTYELPRFRGARLLALPFSSWAVSGVAQFRSGFPFSVVTSKVALDPTTAFSQPLRVDRVQGIPFYLADSTAPGGKRLNPAAFALQTTQRQGTLGRNAVPGFGTSQMDLSLYRTFPLTEKFHLQFRADAFNVLNHPNFSNPANTLELGTFGRSTQMLNGGLGGLSSLYQLGGPRSLQLSLRFGF